MQDFSDRLLGKIGDPRAIGSLARILQTSGAGIGGDAAHALGEIGGKRAQQVLLSALKELEHREVIESKSGKDFKVYPGHNIPSIYGALIQIGIEDIVEDVSDAITYHGQLKPWLSYRLSAVEHPKFDPIESEVGGMTISYSQTSERITEFQNTLSTGTKHQKIDLLNL